LACGAPLSTACFARANARRMIDLGRSPPQRAQR
jgi:hypothetical protein